ncbi:MAG: sigma-54 dependent transcriptional regulator [Candidatus Neomarinimicrobiota bacterium]
MTTNNGKVLIVDDDKDVLTAAQLLLKRHVGQILTETDPQRLPEILRRDNPDVILLDMNFTRDVSSGQEGFQWLGRILEFDSQAVVVLITAYGDADLAVRAIKSGATDFILKPWQNEKLVATVIAALKLRASRMEVNQLRSRQRQLSADLDQPFHNMIGTSAGMQDVFQTIQKVASTDAKVLILGENGTGKELVARAIHRHSARSEEVFITVDMGSISETLFESELFGYVKGAFTDARRDHAGRFETASGGTLFLDEIGNLRMPLQSKLLAALENREITRVGSNTPRAIDIRLICATNRPLQELVAEERFRQDLFYRINTVAITLPPLRERPEDIPQLLEHFVTQYSRKYNRPSCRISSAAQSRLLQYHWPGNVRELQHVVERAVILGEGETLTPEDFPLTAAEPVAGDLELNSFNLDDIEKAVIRQVLTRCNGNVSSAANMLGITRTSLYRRIKKHAL